MNEPTGYTALDLICYTDKGDYSAVATYVKNDLVNYGGSKWRCLIDDTTGVTPVEGLNWTVFVQIPADSTKQIIAPVEQATSTHAYTVGEQLIYNDTLYKVKAPIAIGDSLVVDTNIEASDTIVEQIDQNASDIDDIDAEISAICNVYGSKNMCPTESRVIQGFTYAPDKDGYMSCSTSTDTRSWGYTYANQKFRLKKGTYFIKAFEKTAYTTGYVGLQIFDSNGNAIFIATWATLLSTGQTFTLAADTDIGVEYKLGDGAYAFMIMDNRIKDRTYVPYAPTNRDCMSYAVNTKLGAHNLLQNHFTTQTVNGITVTVASDGVVTLNGTLTSSYAVIPISRYTDHGNLPIMNGAYTLTGHPKTYTGTADLVLRFYNPNGDEANHDDRGDGTTVNYVRGSDYNVAIIVQGGIGKTITNAVVKPMLRTVEDTDTTFAPFAMTNRELTEDTLYSETTVSGLTKTKITKVGKTITMTFNSENPATLKGVTIPAELRPPYDIHGTVIYRDTATHTIYYAGLLDITSAGAVYMYYTPTYGSARTEITTNTTGIELIGTITYLTK